MMRSDKQMVSRALVIASRLLLAGQQWNRMSDKYMRKWASHFDSLKDFSKTYSVFGVRPIMWHRTNDKDFRIRDDIYPSDMLGGLSNRPAPSGKGGLMVTSDPSDWPRSTLDGDRDYIAAIDVTGLVRNKDYTPNPRGLNEMYISAPNKAKLIRMYRRDSGISVARRLHKQYPQSFSEMEDIWNSVH